MNRIALFVLGAPRLEKDGIPVKVQRRKAFALLIYLAVTGESHQRDTLAALFWPEVGQSHARAALRRILSELNQALEKKVIQTDEDNLLLSHSIDFWLDADEFRRLLKDNQEHHHLPGQLCFECFITLTDAAKIYHADFLTGFTLKDSAGFDEWQSLQSECLRQEFIGVLEQLVLQHQTRGEFNLAIQCAKRWLELDPWDESSHRYLMQLYAISGQRNAALRQYQECVRILGSDLCIQPEEETTRLYERIRSGGDWSLRQVSPTQSIQETSPIRKLSNLPAQVTSFIGRKAEIEAALGMLAKADIRLLTLVGPSGVGKTRLGLQIAQRLIDDFTDGVVFVSLASLSDPNLVTSSIAQSFGLLETSHKSHQDLLREFLSYRNLLLVLDNFEQIIPAALQISNMLSASPGLKILLTSREPLHIYGEQLFPVPPLSLPESHDLPTDDNLLQFEAIHLFVDRARAVLPSFALEVKNSTEVAEICRYLDGLPLAIELAAAHIRSIPLSVMSAQFEKSNALFPFHLLTRGPRDAPARQHTLRNAIAWSYDLLAEDEKILFRRIAVFAGGSTLEAIEAMYEGINEALPSFSEKTAAGSGPFDLLFKLESLVDKSLLIRSEVDGELRFNMLQMVRAYALEKLALSGEEQLIRQRHAEYYLTMIETDISNIGGQNRLQWLNCMDRERDNLRTLLSWSLSADNDKPIELRLQAVLKWLGEMQLSFSEQRRWLEQALSLLGTNPLACQQEVSLVLESELLGFVGGIAYFQGDYSAACTFLKQGASISRELDEKLRLSHILIGLCWAVVAQGDTLQTKAMAEEALALGREVQDAGAIAQALNHLGGLALLQKNYDQAESLYNESLYWFKEARDIFWEAMVLLNMGQLTQDKDDQARAKYLYRKGLILFLQLTNQWGVGLSLEKCARSASAYGQFIKAVRLFAAAEHLLESIGFVLEAPERQGHETYLNLARSGLDPKEFAAAWAGGKALPLDQAVTEALDDRDFPPPSYTE